MAGLFFNLVPFFFVLIVVPIILARRKRGPTTWFPAQIIALFALVAGIVMNQNGWSGSLGADAPLAVLTLIVAAAMAATALLLHR